jgi:Ca2+/Na+ antiporter
MGFLETSQGVLLAVATSAACLVSASSNSTAFRQGAVVQADFQHNDTGLTLGSLSIVMGVVAVLSILLVTMLLCSVGFLLYQWRERVSIFGWAHAANCGQDPSRCAAADFQEA